MFNIDYRLINPWAFGSELTPPGENFCHLLLLIEGHFESPEKSYSQKSVNERFFG